MEPDEDELDPKLEWRYRAIAIPVVLVLALLFNRSNTGHWFQRTFLTMIPHELGHAATAWWCGFAALPGLWKTLVPETRSVIVPLVLAAVELGLAYVGWRTSRMWLVACAVVLGLAQVVATTSSVDTAHVAITYGGDGGAMIIGTLLILAFFVPEGSRLRVGALRWGLLVIGAAAYVDTAMTWVRARADHDLIPFGEIEGVGLSDPSKLADWGWSPKLIVARYVTLAGACLAVITLVWAYSTWTMRRRALAA